MTLAVILAVLASGELTASPRTPATLLALADTQAAPLLQEAFARALLDRTDLQLVPANEPKKLAACEGRERFGCWTRAVDAKSAYLFVISAQADRAQMMMIDLSAARATLAAATGEAAENRIFEEAMTMSSGVVELDDAAALERWAIDLLERDLKARLERKKHWAVFGSIILHAPQPGLSISMNGTKLGFTAEGATKIRDVRQGTHTIAIDELRETKSIIVQPSATAEVRFEAAAQGSTVRTATLWTGVALAATGAVIEAAAIAKGSPITSLEVCRGIDCDVNAPNRFTRAGPFLAAPLGYAMFGAGATWVGGAALSDENEDPWIALIAGGAVGALAYGLSAALEGSR